jgi:hypothetical protein
MYARRVAEAVELAKARARSIMYAAPDATPVELATAGAKPKPRAGRERAAARGAAEKKPRDA